MYWKDDDQSKKPGQKSDSEGIAPDLEAEDATRVWQAEDQESADDVANRPKIGQRNRRLRIGPTEATQLTKHLPNTVY